MEALNSQANLFASGDHFDKDRINLKAVEVKERYEKLKAPMTSRKQKLTEAQSLQQFLRDVEDEEDWIREKEPIAASTNRGGSSCLCFNLFCAYWPNLKHQQEKESQIHA